jgi:hypothetical protein
VAREGCLPAGRASVSLGEVACEARDDDSSLRRQPAAPGSARLGSPGRMRCVLVFGVSAGTRRDVSPAAVGAVGHASGEYFSACFFFGGFCQQTLCTIFPRYLTHGDEVSSCYNGRRGFDGSMGSMGVRAGRAIVVALIHGGFNRFNRTTSSPLRPHMLKPTTNRAVKLALTTRQMSTARDTFTSFHRARLR